MARILIVGCGYVGIALGLRLVRAGHDVFGARRNPERLPPEIRPIRVDVHRPAGLAELPSDLDRVFFLAAAGESDDDAYKRVYVTGLGNVLESLGRAGTRRLCFVSSTAVYGQQDGSIVDETSPTEPTSFRGVRMLEAERLVHRSPFEGIVARSAGIYGPGRARLIDRIRIGDERVRGGAASFTNRIHRDDLAAALVHLIQMKRPDPTYICSDNEPATGSEVVEWIARQQGTPVAIRPTPPDPQRSNKRCSNARLRASGFELRYPSYREGYGEILASHGSGS